MESSSSSSSNQPPVRRSVRLAGVQLEQEVTQALTTPKRPKRKGKEKETPHFTSPQQYVDALNRFRAPMTPEYTVANLPSPMLEALQRAAAEELDEDFDLREGLADFSPRSQRDLIPTSPTSRRLEKNNRTPIKTTNPSRMADNLFARRFKDTRDADGHIIDSAAAKQERWQTRIAENTRKLREARAANPGARMPEIMRAALSNGKAHVPTTSEKLTEALGVKVKPGAVRFARAAVRDSQKRSDLFRKAAGILQRSGASAEYQVITPALLKKIIQHERVTGRGASKLREYQAKLEGLSGAARTAKMAELREAKLNAMSADQRAKYEAAKDRRRRRVEGIKPITRAFNAEHAVARSHMRKSTSNRNARVGKYHIQKHVREQAERGIVWAPYNEDVAKQAQAEKEARNAARRARV